MAKQKRTSDRPKGKQRPKRERPAINENAKLRRQLAEARREQVAAAEILKVISRSSNDLRPVLNAIAETAAQLCNADFAFVYKLHADTFHLAASSNANADWVRYVRDHPVSPGRGTVVGRTLQERQTVHVKDVLADLEYADVQRQRLGNYRTILGVPLLRDQTPIGSVILLRSAVKPFSVAQINLVETFADQAVIAIENVRLFDEVQAKTSDLEESLQQQTATSDVLKVISRSAFDLEPVFRTIVQTASRLCEAEFALIYELHGDKYEIVAFNNAAEAFVKHAADNPLRPGRGSLVGRTALERKPVHIPDCLADREYSALDYQTVGHYRAMLGVPLLREGVPIGVIGMMRTDVRPFTEKQIELVTTFADQAVIAIENVRLFEQVQAKTRDLTEALQQQTATADVLKIISRSAFDLKVVLGTLLRSAGRLCEADMGVIARRQEDVFYRTVAYGLPDDLRDLIADQPVELSRNSGSGRALLEGRVIQINDVEADAEYTHISRGTGAFRTLVGVPMMREGVPVGVMTLMRKQVQPFTEKQIELLSTFADQAAIAIENVRLFDAEQQRTRELTKSLEDLRRAQDRLVQTQKLASLGQLTAGIAHEIKNPLNFVNNFSGVSVELIDELQETLGRLTAEDKTRGEIAELAETLRDNLDKIAQHGKRADSIVKNMLLHSREGSGERRPVDVNALVEESLNLAYHGARAETQGFNIALERSFDPAAGEVEAFPQEITRVLLNVITNGFYAATKRQGKEGGNGFEPTIRAATKSLGDRVEIRIRDNGIGIPPEVREKIFNPFFTTKPAGEGTGLGLSISHDIIVKQHSGSIEVDTEPGSFAEFKIILPRTTE
jgi:two-component system, NtrC family, sensor kinase